LLILFKKANELNKLRAALKGYFKMKDLGLAKSCIGIKITQEEDGIKLDQSAYIKEILKRFGMIDCAPVKNPCSPENLSKCQGEKVNVPYREAIGSLLFLAQATRPDIAYAVSAASRYNENHNEGQWKGVKRIFRYLQLTKNYCLSFLREGGENLHGFTDSDYGGDIGDRKSTSGYVFMFSGAAVSWKSTHQRIVAFSSTEAEYIAASEAVCEALWLRQLANELKIGKYDDPTTVYCDNTSAINLAHCNGYRPRTKHIDIRYHGIRDYVSKNLIKIDYVQTEDNTADMLTKPITAEKLIKFCEKAGLN
jgi:hypothetical protein